MHDRRIASKSTLRDSTLLLKIAFVVNGKKFNPDLNFTLIFHEGFIVTKLPNRENKILAKITEFTVHDIHDICTCVHVCVSVHLFLQLLHELLIRNVNSFQCVL